MKIKDVIIVAASYFLSVALTFAIASLFRENSSGVSQCVGAILASQVAAILYGLKNDTPAPFKVKAFVSMMLVVLCVIQGLVFQVIWHWMEYPDISLTIGGIGTFFFPFLFWKTMEKGVVDWRHAKKSKDGK
jgi:hypothetical protein